MKKESRAFEKGYPIGEVSKITGISKDTLHFYIKSGLMTPDYIDPEHLYALPGGDYAVCTACIRDEEMDFRPLLDWLEQNGFTTDFIVAEELGFQLFKYIHHYFCEIRAHLVK